MRVGSLALLLAAACSAPPEGDPRPTAVDPPRAASDVDVDIQITGENLDPRVTIDFSDSKKSAVDPGFTARLGDTELLAVSWTAPNTLSARVPAGLPVGLYDLSVTDPAGRTGALPQAYRVVTSDEDVASFQFEPIGAQRAGVPFPVSLAALDARGRVVDGFSGRVELSDASGQLHIAATDAFVLGRLRSYPVVINAPAAVDRLLAKDALAHAGTSNDFEVKQGQVTAIDFLTVPEGPVAGACAGPVVLVSRDARQIEEELEADETVALSAGPSSTVAFFSDAACTAAQSQLAWSKGLSRASFYFRATQAGTANLEVTPSRYPSAQTSVSIQAGPASQLGFATPSRVAAVGACSSALVLQTSDAFQNPSPVQQALSISVSSTAALFSDATCGTPASSLSIPAGATTVALYFQASSAGAFTVTAQSALGGATQSETAN